MIRLISIKLPHELKEKMKKYPHINWTEIAISAIIRRIELEDQLSKWETKINHGLLEEAIEIQDRIRKKIGTIKNWSSTEAIRKWRAQKNIIRKNHNY